MKSKLITKIVLNQALTHITQAIDQPHDDEHLRVLRWRLNIAAGCIRRAIKENQLTQEKDHMKRNTTADKSEFGTGFIYNLILFAKHAERVTRMMDDYKKCDLDQNHAIAIWFNGAGDHLFNFNIPKVFQGTEIGTLALEIQRKCLAYRMSTSVTKEEYEAVFADVERLTRMVDEHFGVDSEEAEWA
jgi:hypothetical protein